ncbi:kelch domain-containing protein 1 isoform X2 [Nilaparvata lugens]|uniref:kelch domain-containing protein 1 isoform X2 n=1 Tax=Nilaparvata lugens TaxID=108931 RepID=UPI00193E8F80|nr:kelch domain-containing protein 1 isoform X2 [Nilaparvata lugens]XP_039293742.1 kelch domain-containing protein 1 isoform X2 [Nilaparvata lugens]XP_039293743.1 kelch domain-containing protein 1 isoform X2 [Nilaparvata lugens]
MMSSLADSDYEPNDSIDSDLYNDDICVPEPDHSEVFSRSGHVAIAFENELIVWGGTRCVSAPANDYCDPNILWVYNTLNDVYTKHAIFGVAPPGSCGSCAVIHDGSLYIFGGFTQTGETYHNLEYSNLLHRLDLTANRLTWNHISPKGTSPLPCDKLAGWVYGDKLYFFGGFGRHVASFADSQWIPEEQPTGRGWNNQLFCYDPATKQWQWPRTYGPKPQPRAAHSAAIQGNCVYVFGGRLDDVRNDQLHRLNMDTMTWSGDLKCMMKGPHWPPGRSWHTFTFTAPNVAFIHGGLSNSDQTLDDVWKLTIEDDAIECEMQPSHIIEGGAACPLLWHKSVFFQKGNEIITIGGLKELNNNEYSNHPERLLNLRLSPKSLFRQSLDALKRCGQLPEAALNSLPAQLKVTVSRRMPETDFHFSFYDRDEFNEFDDDFFDYDLDQDYDLNNQEFSDYDDYLDFMEFLDYSD